MGHQLTGVGAVSWMATAGQDAPTTRTRSSCKPVHPEADLPHDLPIAIRTLWRRDGERWEEWERRHQPVSLQDIASMVLDYLEVDMGGAPVSEVEEWCAHCCQYRHEEDACRELDWEPEEEGSGEELITITVFVYSFPGLAQPILAVFVTRGVIVG
ncbi:UNVERIFIED_CONTAM: hypothetical protein FKN15_075509 [Acipenser sinensis]